MWDFARTGPPPATDAGEVALEALALTIAFPLLMLALVLAIVRRDQLLAEHEVCEREMILMDDRLGVARTRILRRRPTRAAARAVWRGAIAVYVGRTVRLS